MNGESALANSEKGLARCSTVSLVRTYRRLSFRLPMKRFARPFPRGGPARAGVLPNFRNFNAPATYRPCAASPALAGREALRAALGKIHRNADAGLPQALQRFEMGATPGGMEAHATGATVTEGYKHDALPHSHPAGRHVGDPPAAQGIGYDVALRSPPRSGSNRSPAKHRLRLRALAAAKPLRAAATGWPPGALHSPRSHRDRCAAPQ